MLADPPHLRTPVVGRLQVCPPTSSAGWAGGQRSLKGGLKGAQHALSQNGHGDQLIFPCHGSGPVLRSCSVGRHLPHAPAHWAWASGPPVMWVCIHTGLPPTTDGPAAADHERAKAVVVVSFLSTQLATFQSVRLVDEVAQVFARCPPATTQPWTTFPPTWVTRTRTCHWVNEKQQPWGRLGPSRNNNLGVAFESPPGASVK